MDKKQVPNHMKAFYETIERHRQEQNIMVLYKLGLISALDVWVKFKELDIKMKNMFGAVIVLFLMGCAGGSSGGTASPTPAPQPTVISCAQLAGVYDNQMHQGETMQINSSCQLIDSLCGYQVTFTEPDYNTGDFILTVLGTNGTPGCMSSTAHSCKMQIQGVQLGVACDNGTQFYLFNKR